MLKPIIIIDGFSNGIVPDATLQLRNGCNFCYGIDLFKEQGILQVSQKVSAMTQHAAPNNITGDINWIVYFTKDNVTYALDDQGRIYDYTSSEWALEHTDGNTGVGNGMIEYNDYLYWASNGSLGRFDGGVAWTDSYKAFTAADTNWHPMAVFNGRLYVGDGKYVAMLESDGTWSATKLTLPVGYRVRSMAVYGDRLIIGTWRGTQIYYVPEATMFSWDGVSASWEQVWTLGECGIHALYLWQNVLIVFAGTAGNIYQFNGVNLSRIVSLPKIKPGEGEWGQVGPGAVCEWQGNLLFGFRASEISPSNIYCLGRKTSADPLALTVPIVPTSGKSGAFRVTAIAQYRQSDLFYAFHETGATPAYGVDHFNSNRRISSGAYWESQIYEISRDSQSRPIKGFEILARPLQTSNTGVVEYKKDNASAWTSWGTITSANQDRVFLKTAGLAKTLQLRLEFTTATGNNYSPEIFTIKIF